MFGIDPEKKGFQLVRMPALMAVMLSGSGYAKVHVCGNAENTYQIRLTGAGKKWLKENFK